MSGIDCTRLADFEKLIMNSMIWTHGLRTRWKRLVIHGTYMDFGVWCVENLIASSNTCLPHFGMFFHIQSSDMSAENHAMHISPRLIVLIM